MHQTTVRFSTDLWAALDAEARRLGVSIAHYVREAALARLMYTAGRRGDRPPASAYEPGPRAGEAETVPEAVDPAMESDELARPRARAKELRAAAETRRNEVAGSREPRESGRDR
jgi:hypothetical protein